jgi:hypothetical protein
MAVLEHRVDRLEIALEEFMRSTNTMLAEFKAQAEKDRQQAELGRQQSERNRLQVDQELRDFRRQMGEMSNRLGTIVEDMIAPSLVRMATAELNCGDIVRKMSRITQRHPRTRLRREFDLIIEGTQAVLFNQTKTTARPEWAREFVEFLRNGEFYEYFPEYQNKPLVPVFSALNIPEDVVIYLTRQRVYAVAMGDEMMEVLNLNEVRAQA